MQLKWIVGWAFPSTNAIQGYAKKDDGSLAEFASEEEAWQFAEEMVEKRGCHPAYVAVWSEGVGEGEVL